MTTVTLPAYRLVLGDRGDPFLVSWDPVDVSLVLPGRQQAIRYENLSAGDGFFSSFIFPQSLDVAADGVSILRDQGRYWGLADVEIGRIDSNGFDADYAVLTLNAAWDDQLWLSLAGDRLPPTVDGFVELVSRIDPRDTGPIPDGPLAPGARIAFADLPGARVTEDDRVDLRARPDHLGSDAPVKTGPGDDRVLGGAGSDVIRLGSGNDLGRGGGGSDEIDGGGGRDTLFGARGSDALEGGAGADRIDGGAGDDVIRGGRGADDMRGGRGRDEMSGDGGRDAMRGDGGGDRMTGGAGGDDVRGGGGRDALSGGAGRDRLDGGAGRDALDGDGGRDVLIGGGGGDRLSGGGGADVLQGGAGGDLLRGGRGDDTFVFAGGNDRIADFALRGSVDTVVLAHDRLLRGAGPDDARDDVVAALRDLATEVGGDLVLDFGRRGTLAYEGRDLGDLPRVLNEGNLVLLAEAQVAALYDL